MGSEEIVEYCDCLDKKKGLSSLKDQSIELGFADPPFNIDLMTNVNCGKKFCNVKPEKKFYGDNRDDYAEWCSEWLNLMIQKCRKVIVYCGNMNTAMWYRISDPLDQLIYYMPFGNVITPTSWINRYQTLLIYAKDKNEFLGRGEGHSKFDTNVIVKESNWNIIPKRSYVHPCPIDDQLIFRILWQLRPRNCIDPFLGSGATLESCKMLGIAFFGWEINPLYKTDIDLRSAKARPIKKLKQHNLSNYFKLENEKGVDINARV